MPAGSSTGARPSRGPRESGEERRGASSNRQKTDLAFRGVRCRREGLPS
ncbi:hypothetical protein OCOJLMKI_0395 [Methylobacterium iners]|uniref:Uncharacterized protein n=1 Tax=Methylobacterium iners TaxID=418707 RepID=A0ABQ4RR54_9HYPH|nr:hypothetical protein OCOJLMKI_0395 [Methylobacterium iners]